MPLVFEVEPLGALFALIAAGLWIVTSVYSIGYMRGHHEENQTRFFAFFALAIAAALGAAFAGNMLTLFFCYEALTLSTYPLVTHHRSAEAKAGGRVYMGVLLSTSICFLLLAMVATYHLTGTLAFVPGGILAGKAPTWILGVLLFLYAFGTGKAALMPFHRWLPAAMVAPAPVSALLHAVAVVKAGVFTVLKVVVYIFGIDLLADTGLGTYLAYVACATILIGSLVAMTKDNLKARLAYSTVSQLSYIVLGAALANSWGILGGSLHIAMHAFGKITLFFCAGGHCGCLAQDRDQRDEGHWPANAVDDGGLSHRFAQHHRLAAAGRCLEQVVPHPRRVGRRAVRGHWRTLDKFAAQHCLPVAGGGQRLLLRSTRWRRGPTGSPAGLCPAADLHGTGRAGALLLPRPSPRPLPPDRRIKPCPQRKNIYSTSRGTSTA